MFLPTPVDDVLPCASPVATVLDAMPVPVPENLTSVSVLT